MQTAGGFRVLIRAFRLTLTVEGLRPHTIHNYTKDVGRFVHHYQGRKRFPSSLRRQSETVWSMP